MVLYLLLVRVRSFRGVQKLPTTYTSSTNAWMTRDVFHKWLVDFNTEISKEKRPLPLLLLTTVHVAHPKDAAAELTHIHLCSLPFNVTSYTIIQPYNMGIITTFKALYM